MKTSWQRRLSVFSAGCNSSDTLLARSPYQCARNAAPGSGKKVDTRRGCTQTRPGQLSSRASSTQACGRLSGYKSQGNSSASHKDGRAPVTFNRKIASSGYGMTYPKQQLGKLPPKPKRSETEPGASQAAMHAANIQRALGAQRSEGFHVWDPRALCEAAAKKQVGSSPVTSISVSLDGSHVLVGTGNGDLRTLPTSLSRSVLFADVMKQHEWYGLQYAFDTVFLLYSVLHNSSACVCSRRQVSPCGHSANVPILSTGWSHCGKHILSSCQYGIVCIWKSHGTEPTLTLTTPPKSGTKHAAVAAFCAMDRLVMVGSGSNLDMYWYAYLRFAVRKRCWYCALTTS